MRTVLALLALSCQLFSTSAMADDSREKVLVNQMAAASVFISFCPSITFGPGLQEIREELNIELADLQPGGRYYDSMVKSASDLKMIKAVAGTDNAEDACPQALKTYGPEGFAYRNLIMLKQ